MTDAAEAATRIDEIYAAMGIAASITPVGGTATDCTILLNDGGGADEAGDDGLTRRDRLDFKVRASEITTDPEGGSITFGNRTYRIDSAKPKYLMGALYQYQCQAGQ